MPVMTGGGLGHMVTNAGAPVAGTNEVQTITIGGTPTGGTFALTFDGWMTQPITWSNVNATLLAAITAALVALPNVGAGGVVCAAGTLTAGVGTLTVTFSGGNVALKAVPTMTAQNNMTGAGAAISVAETTPGVDPTSYGAPKGAVLVDTTNAILYINTGTPTVPVWTKVGTQT